MNEIIFDVLSKIHGVMIGKDKEFFTIEEVGLMTEDMSIAELSDMARAKEIPSHQYQGRTYLIFSEIHELIEQEMVERERKEGIFSSPDPDVLYIQDMEYRAKDIALLQLQELLTSCEVAVVTGLSLGFVLGLVLDNKIPYHGEGEKVYFTKSEIKEWMKFSPCYLELWTKKNL